MKPPTVFLGEMTTLEVEAFLKTKPHRHRAGRRDRAARPARAAADRRLHPAGGGAARGARARRGRGAADSTTRCRIRTSASRASCTSGFRPSWRWSKTSAVCFAPVGFKRIVFLNGHYDNTYAIAYACANAADKLPRDVKAFPVNYWDGMPPDVTSRVHRAWRRACTPTPPRRRPMLAINPDLVDMEKANAEFPPFPEYTVNTGAGAHGVLLHRARLGLLGDQVGHLGRRPGRHAGDGRTLSPARRQVDDRRAGEHREDVRGDAAEGLRAGSARPSGRARLNRLPHRWLKR